MLIAESEINCAQMVEEWRTITEGFHALAAQAKVISTLASAGALLMAVVSAFRRGKSKPAEAKHSWWQTVLKGAGLVSSLWLAARSPGHSQKKNS